MSYYLTNCFNFTKNKWKHTKKHWKHWGLGGLGEFNIKYYIVIYDFALPDMKGRELH